jgi:ferredoxin-type protein NapH
VNSKITQISSDSKPRLGPNGKPVRPFVMPNSFWGKIKVWRFILYRRFIQLGTLLLFFGSAHWGWSLFDKPILRGNLSASELLGIIPLADPFATLQIFLTGHVLQKNVLIGALIVSVIYLLLGARVWCSWVCPVNMITDLAGWIRKRLNIKDNFRVQRKLRYVILGLSLLLSALTGVAAFEWISPISIFHRELIFGLGTGWVFLLVIFLFDLFVLKHGWCGHFCPLGAFYSTLGKITAPLRISFDSPTCTHCLECIHDCPEPQVLNFKKAGQNHMIKSSECTNCGRCITVCPEDTLKFNFSINSNQKQQTTIIRRTT